MLLRINVQGNAIPLHAPRCVVIPRPRLKGGDTLHASHIILPPISYYFSNSTPSSSESPWRLISRVVPDPQTIPDPQVPRVKRGRDLRRRSSKNRRNVGTLFFYIYKKNTKEHNRTSHGMPEALDNNIMFVPTNQNNAHNVIEQSSYVCSPGRAL